MFSKVQKIATAVALLVVIAGAVSLSSVKEKLPKSQLAGVLVVTGCQPKESEIHLLADLLTIDGDSTTTESTTSIPATTESPTTTTSSTSTTSTTLKTTTTTGKTTTTVSTTPAVTGLSSHQGQPGDSVTIYGRNFGSSPAVYFADTAAAVGGATDTAINVTVPNGTGTVDVTVTTNKGTSATNSGDRYTFNSTQGASVRKSNFVLIGVSVHGLRAKVKESKNGEFRFAFPQIVRNRLYRLETDLGPKCPAMQFHGPANGIVVADKATPIRIEAQVLTPDVSGNDSTTTSSTVVPSSSPPV